MERMTNYFKRSTTNLDGDNSLQTTAELLRCKPRPSSEV